MSNGIPTGTNQRAELLGFASILVAFPNTPLHVQLDSQYTLNIASNWIHSWAKANWKRKEPLKNLDIIQPMHKLLLARTQPLTFEWVKGHNKHGLNTVADVRCGEASRRSQKSGLVTGNYLDSTGATSSVKQDKMLEAFGLL